MVGNRISAVTIWAVYAAPNARGTSHRRTQWLPETDPTQRQRLSAENASVIASGGASSIASHFDGEPAFLPRSKSPVSSEDLL